MYTIAKFFEREILPVKFGNYESAQKWAEFLTKKYSTLYTVLKTGETKDSKKLPLANLSIEG